MIDWKTIDWTNPAAKVGRYFSVHEALYIPSWRVQHVPSDREKQNICLHAAAMDKARELVGKPFNVHCWIRPTSVNAPGTTAHGKNYNKLVGGATRSQHIGGLAVDFSCFTSGINCDKVRDLVRPHLEEFKLVMEEYPGSGWVHLDSRFVPVGGSRTFRV